MSCRKMKEMDKQLTRLSIAVVVLAAVTIANTIAVLMISRQSPFPKESAAAIVSHKEPAKSQLADDLLEDQSLIQLAGSREFRRSTEEERKDLIEEWCQRHMPKTYAAMSIEEQLKLLDDLARGLHELLAERNFSTT